MKSKWLPGYLALIVTAFLVGDRSVGASRRTIPDWQIIIAQKQGPNTCAVEEIPGTNKKYWTECKYWSNREICGVKTVIRYECCEGFQQLEGKHGCTGVKPLMDILETARNLGATSFVDFLIQTGIGERLREDGGAHTLFAPTNEAFKSMVMIHQEIFNHSLRDFNTSPLLYHIVPKRIHSKDFGANFMADTLLGAPQLRINRFANGMMSVNCAPIIRKDQEALDGIVHLLDQVLLPPSSESFTNVAEMIYRDGRFRELSKVLIDSNLVNELRFQGPFTIFAPFDEAFQKISPTELRKITDNPKSKLAFLKNHIVNHPICPTAIIDNHKMKTLGGERLHFSCNGTSMLVNGVRMPGETILAENGLVVVINDLLIPNQVRSIVDIAKDREYISTFNRIAKFGALEELIKVTEESQVSIFAPTDAAFEEIAAQELDKLHTDPEAARSFLNYHTTYGRVTKDTIIDNQRVDNLNKQSILRLKVYRKALGVENAIIQEGDVFGQNGVLHVIDKVLYPPDLSTLEMFRKDRNFSLFANAIGRVRETDPHFLNVFENDSITIFAPNDYAFQQMDEDELAMLMEDSQQLKQVIQNHVVDNMISSGSFQSRLVYRVPTENEPIKVHKGQRGNLMVNSAHVIKEDLVTKDGIVHCIDKVLVNDPAQNQDRHGFRDSRKRRRSANRRHRHRGH